MQSWVVILEPYSIQPHYKHLQQVYYFMAMVLY